MIGIRTDLGNPRLFQLIRDEDASGVSGEGRVADGVQWPDGRVSFRWRTRRATTVDADSIEDVEAIHGHEGRTRVVWVKRTLTSEDLWGAYTGNVPRDMV